MQHYDDVDYDQFLHPHRDPAFQPDLHRTFLPASAIAKQAADNPPQHKILLVPADPNYSPTADELSPAVHQAVLDCLAPHPEFRDSVVAAVGKVIADHRGWRNPQPYNKNMAKQPRRSRSN